jgi:DNA-binding transcriptional LysR family regulator
MRAQSPHYEAFVAVVRLGTVTEAAKVLNLPRPTVSRHIARLESDLGVALLHRTTRRITPTTAGQQLFERVEPLLEQWDAVESDLRNQSGTIRGTVRISVLPLVAPAMASVVGRLHQMHPELMVDVAANVRLVDLRTERFDAAIWAGDPRDPELLSRTLTAGHVGLVAAPGYIAEHGTPATVADLAAHTLLRGHSGDGRPRAFWPLHNGGRIRVRGPFATNDAALLRQVTLLGQGICLLSDLNAGAALFDGRLVRVLPGVVGITAAVLLLVAQQRRMPSRVRVLIDAIAAHFDAVHAEGR